MFKLSLRPGPISPIPSINGLFTMRMYLTSTPKNYRTKKIGPVAKPIPPIKPSKDS